MFEFEERSNNYYAVNSEGLVVDIIYLFVVLVLLCHARSHTLRIFCRYVFPIPT
jgi:hypothetical protein